MISRLNKTFVAEQILTNTELNQITSKVDEIVDSLSSSSQGGGDDTPGGYTEPEGTTGGTTTAITITIDDWNKLTDKDKDAIYVVTSNDGSTIVGIGVSSVLTSIPVPASGIVVKLSQEQYDALSAKDAGTLYFIEQNGVIVKAYLGDKEITPDSDNEGVVKSLLTSMFSEKITWDGDTVKSLNWSIIDVDKPGEFYATTGLEDIINQKISTAGFLSQTDENGMFAEMFAAALAKDNTVAKKASIIASINDSEESNITINADKINLQGYVKSEYLESGKATIKGDISATSFKVVDGENPTIIFTTMSDEYRGDGYENLNTSGIVNGEPIGLVFDPTTHKPKYFFDFAPVANSGGTAHTLHRYLLSNSGVTSTTNLYYNEVGMYYSDQAGTNVANDSTITYRLEGYKQVFVRHTSTGTNAKQNVFIASAAKYRGYTYKDGRGTGTGDIYYRVTGVDGSAYWLAKPESLTIMNPNENIKTSFGGQSLSNASNGVQFDATEYQSVTLYVMNTVDGLTNLWASPIPTTTTWTAGQYYITTTEETV